MDSFVNQHGKKMDVLDVLIACYEFSDGCGRELNHRELFNVRDVNKMKPIILQHLKKFHAEWDLIINKKEFMKNFDKAVEISFSCDLMEMGLITEKGEEPTYIIEIDRRLALIILKEMIREKIPIVTVETDNVIEEMEDVSESDNDNANESESEENDDENESN